MPNISISTAHINLKVGFLHLLWKILDMPLIIRDSLDVSLIMTFLVLETPSVLPSA